MITLNITPDLETQIRQAADQAGVALDTYVVNILKQHLPQINSLNKILSDTEATLLQQINLGLPPETWQQYHQLIEKRRTETLSPTEQKTLIEITDQFEMANTRRISALVQLAQYRQTSLDNVMADLGIKSPTYD